MQRALTAGLDAVRRPEYTGENRCTPCTLVNATAAVLLAVSLGLVVPLAPMGAAAVTGGTLLVAAAAIYLRGYLVPGTPHLTRTYLPDRVLRYFEHDGPTTPTDGVDPLSILTEAGATTECVDVDDLCLTEEFRAAWEERIDERRRSDTSRADLASIVDVPEDALVLEEYGAAFVALATVDGGDGGHRRRVGQWESRGAFVADMAGADVLRDRSPSWSSLDAGERGRVLNALRIFLEACPTCGDPVNFGEETVESCCRSREVVAVTCDGCGARLFEADAPTAA